MSGSPPLPPDDGERTVIRPSPGGRRPASTTSAPPSAAMAGTDSEIADLETAPILSTKLGAAATPLLQLLARLQNTSRPPDVEDLRERVVREVREFERRARQAGVPMELLRPGHFALCASIDDVVLNTPWGASSVWRTRTVVSTLYQDIDGGQHFFEILGQVRKDPARFLPVIELMYLCLSLGFMGPYRPPQGDPGGFDHIRNEIGALVARERHYAELPLSPKWQGVHAPYRANRRGLPVWVAIAAAVAASGACFVWVTTDLNTASDNVYTRLLAAPPGHMPILKRVARVEPPPPPPAAPEPGIIERLRSALQAEIATGHVAMVGTAATPIVRIGNRGMFPAGSASPQAASIALLERVANALKTDQGSVQVVDYTDNQPIRTVQFPSNFQLSLARAQAVRAIIVRILGDPARVTADGRADADPIASNATAEGRELNRRLEIVLHRQDRQD